MKISLETEIQTSISTPVYNEPYDGFFKEHGFDGDNKNGFCCIKDSYYKIISPTLEGIAHNKPDMLALVNIVLERAIFYEVENITLNLGDCIFGTEGQNEIKCTPLRRIVQKEISGKDTSPIIKEMLSAVQRSGGKAWHCYIVSLSTINSHQVALFEEDFAETRKSSESLAYYAAQAVRDIYCKLNAQKIRSFANKISKLSKTLDKEMYNVMQKFMSGDYGKEIESLPEHLQEQKSKEILLCPINDWLPRFRKELQKSGLEQCEKELYERISDYCASNGIKLRPESGDDFIKSGMMKEYEDAMR